MPRPSALPLAFVLASSLAVLHACGGEDTRAQRRLPEHRLLIVGWDGATFDLIDPLLEAGRLPSLAALLARGSSATLESTVIPISSAAWVGAVTGKGPGETGVYSFFEPLEDSYDVRLVSSRSNRATPIWRMLTSRGLGVNVVGVPVTFPPEPVQGTLIAGMLSPFEAEYAWPPGTAQALRARGFEPDLGIWRQTHGVTAQRLWTQLDKKEELLLELVSANDWVFTMAVFKSLDVVSHGVFDGSLDGPVAQVLERLDRTLGRLVAAVGDDTNILVMSDHGFRAYPQAFNLHAWLSQAGFAQKRPDGARAGVGAAPLSEQRVAEHAARMASLDLPRTRVLAAACEGNFGSLFLNQVGRQPDGAVAPEHADALLDELSAALEAVRQPGGDAPVVTRVWRGTEPGPWRRVVPDLLFETREDVQVVSNLELPLFHAYTGRPTGTFPDHARQGILVAAGPDVAHGPQRGDASVLDIAPLALHLLNQPVYAEMHGRVPQAMLSLARQPESVREEDDPWRAAPGSRDGAYSEEDLEALQQRLRSLGYTE